MKESKFNPQDVKLQPPGAGLPFFDWLVAKYYIFPFHICGFSKQEALKRTLDAGYDCIDIVEGLGEENASKQVLINPLKGIEDSSRNWSAAMTLEHLIIVHKGMLLVMQTLTQHKTLDRFVGTADVKPEGKLSPKEAVQQYKQILDDYTDQLNALSDMKNKEFKHKHPWFGRITAYQWMCINAQHTRIHRHQLKEISKAFD